jgi:hypothetical protein
VFAVAAGGVMNHWISKDGGPWSGPVRLPGGNLVPSVPCAIALPDGSVHVFAIDHGPLSYWSSADGNLWTHRLDDRIPIPGGWNGLAVASMDGNRIDVFATTSAGIIQYVFNAPPGPPFYVLPDSAGLPARLLAAVSPAPGKIDVFAVDPHRGMALHWHFDGSWSRQMVPGALHKNSGLAAVVSAPGQVELFGITPNRQMASWSIKGRTPTPREIPAASLPLPEGVPAVVASGGRLDLFAIGQGTVFQGGPLVHWRYDGTKWRKPTVYDSGLAAGGVTAIKGASGLEAFGFQSGTNNVLLHWPAGIGAADRDPWSNWAGNRTTNLEGHCRPQCLEELVAIVRSATWKGRRVRAVGSSWSFSDVAMTPGYIVETNKLDRILDTVLPQALAPQRTSIFPVPDGAGPPPTPPANHFVHVEAGIQLENLMTRLDSMGLAPATMGGAAGQTLAGVISTSVHGCHYRLPPFPDWVRAIHLVGPDGQQYWIEPKDRPITKDAELRRALGPDVTVKRNNDWFYSALVSVGSLGIVYSVVIEVTSQYKIKDTRTSTSWLKVRPQLVVGGTAFTGFDAVQVVIDPGTMGGNDPRCYLTQRNPEPMTTETTPTKPAFDPLAAFCEGDFLLEVFLEAAKAAGKEPAVLAAILIALPLPALLLAGTLAAAGPILIQILKQAGPGAVGDLLGELLDTFPECTPQMIRDLTALAQEQPGEPAVGIAHQIMAPRNKGECAARGLALEIAFRTEDESHLRFVDAALAMLKQEAAQDRYLGGWFSMRFVGRSRAILSPQQSDMTCMVEAVGLRTLSSTRLLLGRLEALGRDFGGIQHWGMFDVDMTGRMLTSMDVARAYPRLNTWRKVRWELTNGGTVHTFDNDFMARSGLTDPPASPTSWQPLGGVFTSGPAVASWAPNRLDLFGRGTDKALYTATSTGGSAWSAWRKLAPNPIDSDPAAVAWGPNRIDVFARGTDKQMYTMSWTGDRWTGWKSMGGQFTSGPAVSSWGSNRLDVFGRGADKTLYTNTWNGSAWSGWRQVNPRPIDSDPAAISWGPGRIDVFALGSDNQMYQISWAGDRWTDWKPMGGQFTSGPAVASVGPDRLDVFGRGKDQALYTNSWNGTKWSGWRRVAQEPISSDPAAVSRGSNRIQVFARGSDNQMWTKLAGGV